MSRNPNYPKLRLMCKEMVDNYLEKDDILVSDIPVTPGHYGVLQWLIGRRLCDGKDFETPENIRVLGALIGPKSYIIYRILLAQATGRTKD